MQAGMKHTRFQTRLYGAILTSMRTLTCILLGMMIPLSGSAYLSYRILPASGTASRGDSARHLFDILMMRTSQPGECSLSSLRVDGGPAAGSLLSAASLWLVTPSGETRLSTALPDSSGGLRFVLGSPLAVTASSSNLLRLRAGIRLSGSPATRLAFTNTAADITLSPPGLITLSNADHPAGLWPSTNASVMLYHRALSLSNEPSRVPSGNRERGEDACLAALSLRAPLYPLTAAPVSLMRITVQCDPASLAQLSLWLDNGDGVHTLGEETLLGTSKTSGSETSIQLSSALPVTNQPRLVWLTAVPQANAPVGSSLAVQLPADLFHVSGVVSAVLLASPPVESPAGILVQDTRPPPDPSSPEAVRGYGRFLLRWDVPDIPDLVSFRAILSTGTSPTGPLDTAAGMVLDAPSLPAGSSQVAEASALNPLESYTIHLWSRDSAGLWSAGLVLPPAKPDWYTNALPAPSGVRVITSPGSWDVSWQPLGGIPLKGYRIRIADEDSGVVYLLPNLYTRPQATLRPADLGSSGMPGRARLSVVALDANETASANDFTNLGDALARGIAVRTADALSSGAISVWNTVFRARDDRARVVLRLERDGQAIVQVLAIHGQRLATLINRRLSAGTHEFFWDGTSGGSPVNPGLYLIHVRAGDSQRTTRVIVRR